MTSATAELLDTLCGCAHVCPSDLRDSAQTRQTHRLRLRLSPSSDASVAVALPH